MTREQLMHYISRALYQNYPDIADEALAELEKRTYGRCGGCRKIVAPIRFDTPCTSCTDGEIKRNCKECSGHGFTFVFRRLDELCRGCKANARRAEKIANKARPVAKFSLEEDDEDYEEGCVICENEGVHEGRPHIQKGTE